MHIERIKIKEFRNLKDFEILFTRTAPIEKDPLAQPRGFFSPVPDFLCHEYGSNIADF